jgi:radical SAM protein with 4Fe4S-binding SPASM domain
MAEMGGFFLSLTGGEPLLHPQFLSIVERARELSFSVRIATNAMLLDQDVARALTSLAVEHFLISFHSPDPLKFSRSCGIPVEIDNLLGNIVFLRGLGNNITINVTITKENINDVDSIMELLTAHGFLEQEIVFNNIHPRLDGDDDVMTVAPSPDELSAFYLRHPHLIRQQPEQGHHILCNAGRSVLAVDSWGNVHPCTILRYPVGNVMAMSLSEIWASNMFDEIRQAVFVTRHPSCYNCEDKQFCNPCIAQNLIATGSFFKQSPRVCHVAHVKRLAVQGE